MFNKVTVFSCKVENKPGAFAPIAEIIAHEGINIEGCTGNICEGKGFIFFNTNNPQAATNALKKAKISFETHDFVEITLQDKPGELARVMRTFADANINITSQYITMKQTIVFGVNNVPSALNVLQKLEPTHTR